MNEYFIGTVIKQISDEIIFECNAIGYHLKGVDLRKLKVGETTKLYVYHYQKPSFNEYFAFLTPEIKLFFCELISISHIGPKTALRLLNQIGIEVIQTAVVNQNFAVLQTCRGITRKLAQAIINHFQQKQKIYQADPLQQQKWTTVFATLNKLGFNKDAINHCLLKVNWTVSVEEIIKSSVTALRDEYY